nr:retrovirus-related Pol polyprotein from transposon TNT 1-94 [Tanacetum cinerariifolium]
RPLPSLPKLIGVKPFGTTTCLTIPKTKQTTNKVVAVNVKQKTKTKSPPDSSTKKLLLTLMQEVKGLKEKIKTHLETSPSTSQLGSSRSAKGKDSGCSRYMTRVKQYLHTYSKESGPKVVFEDNSLGDTERYGSVNYNGITVNRVAYVNGLKHNLISISQLCDANFKVLFTKTRGTILNQNNEVVLIAPTRRDVYIIDMSSYNEEINACFFAKASPSVNWLWHKRLSYLNFKNINKLAKQNLVAGHPSLTFSKDKICSVCEKGKHHKASFKTKRSISINKFLHHLHMDLFGPVKPQSISHNKYTLVIVNEYSRYTWVFCLKKKSDAADCIISFIKKMENLNEVKVKELRSDNGTDFKNLKLEEFYDEKDNAFRVFNIRRQEMDETYHVTFSEDDEAISQSSIEDIWSREKHIELVNIIGEPLCGITTRSRVRDSESTSAHECLYVNFLSEIEPIRLSEAIKEEELMQEELNQFERNKGFRQEEGIDYDETFAPVVRLEAIRIFLAYAAYMGFMVYQMDVKSAFLNGKISEEVYVQKPPRFESSEFPNHVCKLDKALYGLKQALRAYNNL